MCGGGGGGGGGGGNAESVALQRESLAQSKAQAAEASRQWQMQFDYTKARHAEQRAIANQKPPRGPERSADVAGLSLEIGKRLTRPTNRESYKNLVSGTGLGITNP